MRPLNNMFEYEKNSFNFQFFHIYLPEQKIHHKCFEKSFRLSNTDYFGQKNIH